MRRPVTAPMTRTPRDSACATQGRSGSRAHAAASAGSETCSARPRSSTLQPRVVLRQRRVHLERGRSPRLARVQQRSRGDAKHHGAAAEGIVDRHDHGDVVDDDRDPPEPMLREQPPTLVLPEMLESCGHHPTLADALPFSKGPHTPTDAGRRVEPTSTDSRGPVDTSRPRSRPCSSHPVSNSLAPVQAPSAANGSRRERSMWSSLAGRAALVRYRSCRAPRTGVFRGRSTLDGWAARDESRA